MAVSHFVDHVNCRESYAGRHHNESGEPLESKPYTLAPGENPRAVASRLKREAWARESGRSEFNRPLRYGPSEALDLRDDRHACDAAEQGGHDNHPQDGQNELYSRLCVE
jgi:hypothetical protein